MKPQGSLPHSQQPATCPYPEPHQSSLWPSIPLPEECNVPFPSLRLYQNISPRPRELQIPVQWQFFMVRIVSTSPNSQAGESCFNGCLQLLIQYIHGYPILKAVPPSTAWGRTMPWLLGSTYHRLNNLSHGNWMVDISAYDLELNCGAHCYLHCHYIHI